MRLNELCLYGGRTCPELTTPRRRVSGVRHRRPEHARAEISRERGRPGHRVTLSPPSLTSPGCSEGDESGQDFGGGERGRETENLKT